MIFIFSVMTFLSLFVYSSQFFQINPPTHRHVCTHTHTFIYIYAHLCSHTHKVHGYSYRDMHTGDHIHTHMCVYTNLHTCIHTHICSHIWLYKCICMDVSTCTEAHSCSFIGLHTHMHGNTESLILSICVLSLEKSPGKEELSWRRQDGAHLIISPHLCA